MGNTRQEIEYRGLRESTSLRAGSKDSAVKMHLLERLFLLTLEINLETSLGKV